jgi:carbon storage regulator
MLVLTRQAGQSIVIDENIRITVLSFHGKKVRLGITAPEAIRIDRTEVAARRSQDDDPGLHGHAVLNDAETVY